MQTPANNPTFIPQNLIHLASSIALLIALSLTPQNANAGGDVKDPVVLAEIKAKKEAFIAMMKKRDEEASKRLSDADKRLSDAEGSLRKTNEGLRKAEEENRNAKKAEEWAKNAYAAL